MPSQSCQCVVCSRDVSRLNFCGHLMTHKQDLIPFIEKNPELPYSIVKANDKEYFCCFGCKKHLLSADQMKIHMEGSPDCKKSHSEFLAKLGIENSHNSKDLTLRRVIHDQKFEIERLKEQLEEAKSDSIYTTRIEALEKSLFKAERQITRLQSHCRQSLAMMKPEVVSYAQRWIQEYKAIDEMLIGGHLKASLRKRYMEILSRSPELQFFLLPSYESHILNESSVYNGTYQTLHNVWFRNLTYHPQEDPFGEYGALPALPKLSNGEVEAFMKSLNQE